MWVRRAGWFTRLIEIHYNEDGFAAPIRDLTSKRRRATRKPQHLPDDSMRRLRLGCSNRVGAALIGRHNDGSTVRNGVHLEIAGPPNGITSVKLVPIGAVRRVTSPPSCLESALTMRVPRRLLV